MQYLVYRERRRNNFYMNKFIGKMELFNMFLTLATRRRVVVASSSLHTAY